MRTKKDTESIWPRIEAFITNSSALAIRLRPAPPVSLEPFFGLTTRFCFQVLRGEIIILVFDQVIADLVLVLHRGGEVPPGLQVIDDLRHRRDGRDHRETGQVAFLEAPVLVSVVVAVYGR